MSGGSYDYLCHKEAYDLINEPESLRRMADRLAKLGYAEDAAGETEELICILHQTRVRLATRLKRLQPIWKAVEWWDSGDSGEDRLKETLVEYRK